MSPYDDTDLQKSPPLVTAPADGSSSVDTTPTATTAQQGEGLGELQEAVKSLEEECAKVEEKLRGKGVTLADRRTAVEKFDKDFNKFHKELDYVTEELSKSPPVMSDDDAVKEQIDKTEVSSKLLITAINQSLGTLHSIIGFPIGSVYSKFVLSNWNLL